MDDLTQTISNLVGILLGIVGAVGVGFFVYGAYMYLTASGAPNQMEKGKSAMMTALAGIILAMVAYGVVELVMDAVVNPAVTPDVPEPTTSVSPYRRPSDPYPGATGIGGKGYERTRSTHPRAGGGPGAALVHLPTDSGDDGGVRFVLRRVPVRPRGAVGGEDGAGRPVRPLRNCHGGGKDRRSAAAAGGRRPVEIPAGA